jgi:beta-phosphoglucomutase-like phosphatase (HAD superfamily)
MIAAVCFEPEGLLLDTADARRDALAASLAVDGIALPRDVPPADGAERRPTASLLAHLAPSLDDTARELAVLRAEREFERRLRAGVALVPGAREALEALAGGLRLAVVTRLRRASAEQALALAGLDAHVGVVVAAEDVRHPPPDPAAHRAAHARLARVLPAARPSRAVVALENGADGVRAARAAGLRAIFVGPPDAPARSDVAADARLTALAGLTPLALAAALELQLDPPDHPA